MNIQEYILYIRDHIYVNDFDASSYTKTKISAKKVDRNQPHSQSQQVEIPKDTLTRNLEPDLAKLSLTERPEMANFQVIYKGSYRDIELDVLYRLVCGLQPIDDQNQMNLDPEQRTYDTVHIMLHNISLKNREPKMFTYSIAEIMPESGGEWMSSNYFEASDELHSRLDRLTGHTDVDFTNKDSIIRTGGPSKIPSKLRLFQLTPEGKIEEEKEVHVKVTEVAVEKTSPIKVTDHHPKTPKKVVIKEEIKQVEDGVIEEVYEEVHEDIPEPEPEPERKVFYTGAKGEAFRSFKPSAQLHEEDRKTIEKVREAGYIVPKYNILEDYKKLQQHFLDEEAEDFEEAKKLTKYAQIFAQPKKYTKAQAAAIFQCRYRLKLQREMARRKELQKACTIGFFARKYFCYFRTTKIPAEDSRHFYVKFLVKRSLKHDNILLISKDMVFGKEKVIQIEASELPEEDPEIVECLRAWVQIKVTAPEDYIVYLADEKVPEPEPISLTSCGAPSISLKSLAIDLMHQKTPDQTTRFHSVPKDHLSMQDVTSAALSKMFPISSIQLEGDEEPALHGEVEATPQTPRSQRSIFHESQKEKNAILFIQAMVRAYFKFRKAKKAKKIRENMKPKSSKINISAVVKTQLLAKRWILRQRHKRSIFSLPKEEEMKYLCGKAKKIDEKYYTFKVYTRIEKKEKQKQITLIFFAKELNKNFKTTYFHTLPVYTPNEDSLIKVSQFMIEYCLCFNTANELYMDQEMYGIHKDKLKSMQTIELEKSDRRSFILVPSKAKQRLSANVIFRCMKRFLRLKNQAKSKVVREVEYKSYLKKLDAYYIIKLVSLGVGSRAKHYFLYIECKTDDKNPYYDEHKIEFPIENMKDIELSKPNLDVLFKQFTSIDLLDDEPIEFNWDGYYKKIEELEKFEEELQFYPSH